ncbi:MAG TPA: HD-GYP domain-containing protein [Bacilli bacterium]
MLTHRFFKSILDADSIEESLAILKDYALNTIRCVHLCVLLKDNKKEDALSSVFAVNFTQAAMEGIQYIEQHTGYFSNGKDNFTYVTDTKIKTNHIPDTVRKTLLKVGFRSVYSYSLENRLSYGALIFSFLEPTQLRSEELEICDLIGRHMKQLVEKIQFRKQIVKQTAYENLFNTLKMKDIYTVNHSYNVSFYSTLLGQKFGLKDIEIEKLKIAALLHDIGKIGIPDSILFKPDRLTEEEFNVIKKHPVIGFELIKELPGIEHTLPVIRWHHERLDGNGYPDQLMEAELPLITKIVSLTDAFDAMTSHRVYQKCLTVDEVRGQLLLYSGTQFDTFLVGMFMEILDEQTKMMNSPTAFYNKERGASNE